MGNRALIVVDVQNDFCEGGSLAVEGGNAVAAGIRGFLATPGIRYDAVVLTRDYHIDPKDHFASNTATPEPDYVNTWPDHCVAHTSGAYFHREIASMGVDDNVQIDAVISKGQFSAAYSGFEGYSEFGEQPLETLLDRWGVTDIDVVGIAYDYCVKATAIDGAKTGFNTTVIKSLTASVAPDNDEATTNDLTAAGVTVL